MKIVRFEHKGSANWGILEEESITALQLPPYSGIKPGKEIYKIADCRLLAPAQPSKIILVGLNYRDHARELGLQLPDEPVIFLKPPTSLNGPQQEIVYPRGVSRLDYEGELALIVGKKAKNLSESEALKAVLGYTCLNDVTARDLQKKDGQWTRSKSFDTFCPVGPCFETDLDPAALRIRTLLNNTPRQDSSTSNLIFSLSSLLVYISGIMTLLPGDIISTGTPSGIGPMQPGDLVDVEIEGIGKLSNRVAKL